MAKINNKFLGARIPDYLDNMLFTFINEFPMFNKTDIVTLSLIEFLTKFKINYDYEGINLREIANLHKQRNLREIQKIERREIMSKHLFINNVARNVLLYCAYKKAPAKIMALIETYEKEIKFYNDKNLKLEFDIFKEKLENKGIRELQNYIERQYENVLLLVNNGGKK